MSSDVTNVATGGAGVLVQTGDVNAPVTITTAEAPSEFRWMVEEGFEELRDRDREIARLREFCAGPDPYLWVQAESWSGKSALLAKFARMRHDDLSLVWFFLQRRTRDNRSDFVEVVSHQLATLLAEDMPVRSRLAAESEFRRMLAQAAQRCDGTLVLLVDGLDEEAEDGRGSITDLLPARPPAGLKVIVSSRPQRPTRELVAEDPAHPLRSPDVVWELHPSEHAKVVQQAANAEIRALTHGTAVQQRFLGFMTAARGGLTVRDLADLLRVFDDEVRVVLEGVTGRSFARSRSLWRPDDDRYGFDHDSLWELAVEGIRSRLPDYVRDLRAWALTWQQAGWPADTPEFLLLNYFESAGDPVGLATNLARHARLRAFTGTDATALAEIAAAQRTVGDSDLGALARLAVLHDDLGNRTAVIPTDLPAVWVGLGHVARAESLIAELPTRLNQITACATILRSTKDSAVISRFRAVAASALDRITTPATRTTAQAELACALVAIGDLAGAEALAGDLEPGARTAVHLDLIRATAGDWAGAREACDTAAMPKRQATLVAAWALEYAARGQYERAADLITTRIRKPQSRSEELADLVCFVAGRDPDAAEAILHRIRGKVPYHYVKADAALAVALHQRGRTEEARDRLGIAEIRMATPAEATWHDGAVGEIVRAWVLLGDPDRAVRLAVTLRLPATRGRHLVPLVDHLVRAGFHDHAASLARRACADLTVVTPLGRRTEGYVELIKTVAAIGDTSLTSAITNKARTAAEQVHSSNLPATLAAIDLAFAATADPDRRAALIAALPDRPQRQIALTDLALELAEADDHAGALRAVSLVPDPGTQVEVLTVLATAATDPVRAQELAEAAESAARAAALSGSRSKVLAAVARALLRIGDHLLAFAVARQISDPYLNATTLAAVAATVDPSRAEQIAREIDYPYYRVRALANLLRATDDPAQAEVLLDEALTALPSVDGRWRLFAHTYLASATAAALGLPAAEDLIADASALAAADPAHAMAVHQLAVAVAGFGQHHRAARIARLIHNASQRCRALSDVAITTAELGQVEPAAVIARAVRVTAKAIGDPEERARALAAAAEAQAACARPAPKPSRPCPENDVLPPNDVPPPDRRALAEQLTSRSWIDALTGLADVDPEALRQLASALPELYR